MGRIAHQRIQLLLNGLFALRPALFCELPSVHGHSSSGLTPSRHIFLIVGIIAAIFLKGKATGAFVGFGPKNALF
ncbi:hypothetical protein SDC9_136922 [bioreactor metagenome]|uniref:Uncharacterized protein n=1 Tax=bioreactor metagenome TaxID=1076179 RepID=A0A645DKL0_9ZZZZ